MTKIKAITIVHSQFLIESIRSTSLRTPLLSNDDFRTQKTILNVIFRHSNENFMMTHKLMIYNNNKDHSRFLTTCYSDECPSILRFSGLIL